MKFDDKDLFLAQKEGIISGETFTTLVNFLTNLHPQENEKTLPTERATKGKFTIENFLYYFGALIIICAMGWYLGTTYDSFGHGGLLALSIMYFVVFTLIGNKLWASKKTTPAGLLYVCAVSIVPLAVWAAENILGIISETNYKSFHIWVRMGYILMELGTIAVGLVFLKYRKFPFLTLPICYALWYLSMDIVPLCMLNVSEPTWGMRNFASIVFAILMLGFALKFDRKTEHDFSGWLYIFSSMMLWGGIWSVIMQHEWYNEGTYFLFALFCIVYMIFSIIIKRKTFMVWGSIGFFSYLGHLAYVVFKGSPLFVLALVVLGLGIIFAGTYYAKNCDKIETNLRKLVFENLNKNE